MDDHKNSQFQPHEAAFTANPYHHAKRGSAYQAFRPRGHRMTLKQAAALVGLAVIATGTAFVWGFFQ